MLRIQKTKNNQIFFENGDVIRINNYIKNSFNIKEEKEFSQEEFDLFIYEILLDKAYKMLSRSSKTEKELKCSLNQKLKYPEIIEKVIEALKERGYLDDDEYLHSFVNNKKYGKKRVVYEMGMRGISREKVFEYYCNNLIDENYFISCYMKKLKDKSEEKKIQFLLSKGFEIENILEFIRSVRDDC